MKNKKTIFEHEVKNISTILDDESHDIYGIDISEVEDTDEEVQG